VLETAWNSCVLGKVGQVGEVRYELNNTVPVTTCAVR
jgi:hypothetical protein